MEIIWFIRTLSLVFAITSLSLIKVTANVVSFDRKSADIDIKHELGITIGQEHGISPKSSVTADTIASIQIGLEQRKPDSMYFYGLCKLYGLELSKEPHVAKEYFMKAAALGHKEATSALGAMLYLGGSGLPPDRNTAKYWFKKGVALNDMNSLWLLGKIEMEDGNDSQAALYFKKAADEGHIPAAEHSLAIFYEYGRGVPRSYANAKLYYERASNQYYIESMYHLALMYSYGRGPDEGGSMEVDCVIIHAD